MFVKINLDVFTSRWKLMNQHFNYTSIVYYIIFVLSIYFCHSVMSNARICVYTSKRIDYHFISSVACKVIGILSANDTIVCIGSIYSDFLVKVRAQVMTRDESTEGWLPLAGGGLANVSIRKRARLPPDVGGHEYIIYGQRISDQTVSTE